DDDLCYHSTVDAGDHQEAVCLHQRAYSRVAPDDERRVHHHGDTGFLTHGLDERVIQGVGVPTYGLHAAGPVHVRDRREPGPPCGTHRVDHQHVIRRGGERVVTHEVGRRVFGTDRRREG